MNTEVHEIKQAAEYLFGPFRFIPARRALLCNDVPQRVGGRAIDILAILLERPSETVSKRELISRVWPTTVVEDGNLKVHMAALRRALGVVERGSHYIVTVVGRGYCFVAPVQAGTISPRPAVAPAVDAEGRNPADPGRDGAATATPQDPATATQAHGNHDAAKAAIAHVRKQIDALQSAVEVLEIERDHNRSELQSMRSQLELAIRRLNTEGAQASHLRAAPPYRGYS